MKAVLMSTRPKWCELIADGKKPFEVRKNKPKLEMPFKVYIYATRPKKWFRFSSFGYTSNESLWLSNGKVKMCDGMEFWADGVKCEPLCGKVIGEFICDRIEEVYQCNSGWVQENACISRGEFFDYLGIPRDTHFGYDKKAYAWHISQLKIYDKPKELDEFYVWKKCNACRETGYESTGCSYGDCKVPAVITRPPQSWCYVEGDNAD